MTIIAQALTIAGSDSGGGAGIQADIKTMQMRHVFACSVITAITAQNTKGVSKIENLSTDIIKAQYQAVIEDFAISALKIGMLGTTKTIECISALLKESAPKNIVLDPVMIAKGGATLLEKSAIYALRDKLLPLAHLITPNLPEAEALVGFNIKNQDDIQNAAEKLKQMGAKNIIIKGGHQEGTQSTDHIFLENAPYFNLNAPRIQTKNTHGTGCTFSACITAELAKGQSLKQAIHTAKNYITAAINDALNIGSGHGPTNHWSYKDA